MKRFHNTRLAISGEVSVRRLRKESVGERFQPEPGNFPILKLMKYRNCWFHFFTLQNESGEWGIFIIPIASRNRFRNYGFKHFQGKDITSVFLSAQVPSQ